MTSIADYPDFVRPVAQAESDAEIVNTLLTGSHTYQLGPFDVSQANAVRGYLEHNGASGNGAGVRFQWLIGNDMIAEDLVVIHNETDYAATGFTTYAFTPRGPSFQIVVDPSVNADVVAVVAITSTRPGPDKYVGRALGYGPVLLDVVNVTVPASSQQSYWIPPLTGGLNLRASIGSGPGTLAILPQYSTNLALPTTTIARWNITGGTELAIAGYPMPPLASQIIWRNNDTVARAMNAQVIGAT